MIAVIKTGGKQYIVAPNDTLKIEKIPGEVGATVVFDTVLLTADEAGKSVEIGKPELKAKVTATITKQAREKKVMVVKFKNKTHYRRNRGHRQHFTEVKIEKVA